MSKSHLRKLNSYFEDNKTQQKQSANKIYMESLKHAGQITSMSLADIKMTTNNDCKTLIETIGNIVDKNLLASCTVVSIVHKNEMRANIKTTYSKVNISEQEAPGDKLVYRNEPKELQLFSYEKLKESANLYKGTYRGKLYGTISLSSCAETINCPDCSSSGICSNCEGDKQVTCTICGGNLDCVQCNGTGTYTCTNCKGNGVCSKCNNGWISCNACMGDGSVSCPDCRGSGNYINQDRICNCCGGDGCSTCGGTGFLVEGCRRCNGEGTINCYKCGGNGGWNCKECHGTGKCSHCHGEGRLTCRACNGSGTCGKCKGKGKMWCPKCHGLGTCFTCKGDKLVTCPRCEGSGVYQSYKEYTFDENSSDNDYCTLPIEEKHLSDLQGTIRYSGIAYEMFGMKTNIYDVTNVLNSINKDNQNTLRKWISIDGVISESLGLDKIGNDYVKKYVELYEIPVSSILMECNGHSHHIYIVGNNRMVFYDNLPNWGSAIIGRIKNFFRR